MQAQESTRQRKERRLAELRNLREPMMYEWREIQDQFCPRYMPSLFDNNNGNAAATLRRHRRNNKIINTTPVMAVRTLSAGLMSGATSPARPWFRLTTPDPEMIEYGPVKLWLHQVENILRDIFARSNFYDALSVCYGSLARFGTMALGMFEDEQEAIRCWPYPIGTYNIANSARGSVDTFYVEYWRTVRQVAQQFAMRPGGKEDWSGVSYHVQQAYKTGRLEEPVNLVHAVEINTGRDDRYLDNRNMPVSSCYFEANSPDKQKMLRETGFEEWPIMVCRWDVIGEDPWGSGPALDALGDAKALQYREKQKSKRIDKQNDPALVGHPELKGKRSSLLPGDITYVGFTAQGGKPGLQPIHEIQQDIGAILEDITACQTRISRAMYEDLFLMLALSDRSQITAREVAERSEEKLIVLGPVTERMNNELLTPAIDRAFAIGLRLGRFPPPPEELIDQPLKVQYVSLLAQAQRLVTIGGIERYANFIGGLAAAQAGSGEAVTVIDKLDIDQAADEYAEAMGVPPTVVRSDDQVAALRESRAQQQQMQQMAAAAQPAAQAAKAAKDLSETEVNGRSALERMVGQGA